VASSSVTRDEQNRRDKGHAWLDRWLIPVMALTVAVFVSVALIAVVATADERLVFDPISYSPQVIERIDENGVLQVPAVPGYEPPAVHLDETVPVRGVMTNSADHPVSLAGSVVWQVEPPGPRFVQQASIPSVADVGVTQLRFENEIPEDVKDYVRVHGATRFSINGRVEVLEPGGVDATWKTATFTLVPCRDSQGRCDE
jgi:hypothetical protein